MRTFEEIYEIAAKRHGGAEALEAKINDYPMKSPQELAEIPDDRWLSRLSKTIFATGLNWKVIEAKWPDFEELFDGFDVGRCAFMGDEKFDSLLTDKRIIRNGAKIASVRDNAAFFLELREQGGVGKVIGEWPDEDFIGLLEMLKKRGSRLGGSSASYGLRFVGRPSFIMSPDVVARLVAEGVIDKAPTSKTAMRQVQAAFNTWMDESGRNLTEISRTLAMSV